MQVRRCSAVGLLDHQSAGWGALGAEAIAAGLVQSFEDHYHAGSEFIWTQAQN